MCVCVCVCRWSELAATSNGRMLPLSEFEVAVDHFTTGAGAAQVAALIKAEMAAAALLVPGSMTIHSATARAAANSASSVLAMPLALRAASAHLHATFAAHTVRVPLVAGAAAFDAELARGATEPGDAEPGGAAVTRGSCMPSDGYHWYEHTHTHTHTHTRTLFNRPTPADNYMQV